MPDLKSFVGKYKEGSWIYPGVIKRTFSLSEDDAIAALRDIENEIMVQEYIEIVCPNCMHSMICVLQEDDLPEDIFCPNCDCEVIRPREYKRVVFRKL